MALKDKPMASLLTFVFWRERLKVSTIHLGISAIFPMLAGLLVFLASTRTHLWQTYSTGVPDVLRPAKSTYTFKIFFPEQAAAIGLALRDKVSNPLTAVYLRLAARKALWTVF